MKHFYKELPGENWFNYSAVYDLFIDIIPNNGRFVEVGSWKGRSISYFAVEAIRRNKDINITCVDTWGGNAMNGSGDGKIFEEFTRNTLPVKDKINIMRGDSAETAKLYNGVADIVFLDADHSFDSVCADITAWLPKVKNGGIIAGHDIDWGGVFEAIGEKLYRDNVPGYCKVIDNCWLYFLKGG